MINFHLFPNPKFFGLRKILILRRTYSVPRFLFDAFSFDISRLLSAQGFSCELFQNLQNASKLDHHISGEFSLLLKWISPLQKKRINNPLKAFFSWRTISGNVRYNSVCLNALIPIWRIIGAWTWLFPSCWNKGNQKKIWKHWNYSNFRTALRTAS